MSSNLARSRGAWHDVGDAVSGSLSIGTVDLVLSSSATGFNSADSTAVPTLIVKSSIPTTIPFRSLPLTFMLSKIPD
jgi:hypothetical protein